MKPMNSALGLLLALRIAISPLQAQDVVLPGSTAEGDILRGQGQFLKGMAWYELNAARARQLDVKTARELDQWNREVYDTYQRQLAASSARKRSIRNERLADATRRLAEREKRLRTKPSAEEVQSGDALNALMLDLSDPSISESAWRLNQVPLPDTLAISRLIFQFAARRGDKNSQALTKSLIALGRLEVETRWPPYLAVAELAKERQAYEKAYATIKTESLNGKLTVGSVLEFDKAVDTLAARAKTAVPTARNFRTAAVQAVDGIKQATGMFDASTISFAQEIIADTHEHQAQTVGELLAFMRKYRLLFAPADKRPEDGEQYLRLYKLLRHQKERLGGTGGSIAHEQRPKEWISLFNGNDLSGWAAFQRGRPTQLGSHIVVDRGELNCPASAQGRLETVSTYSGFHLELEYLFPEAGTVSDLGGGIALVPEKLTTAFQLEGTNTAGHLEYQLKPGQSGALAIPWKPAIVRPALAVTERPSGQWNQVEILYQGSNLTFRLNGTTVNQISLEQYWPCHIALLAQGSDIRFRNLRILPSTSEPLPRPAIAQNRLTTIKQTVLPTDGTPFRLVNVQTGKAIAMNNSQTTQGARLEQADPAEHLGQVWTIRSVNDAQVIINPNSGLSIHIEHASSLNKQPLIQWRLLDGVPQECWIFQKHGSAFQIASQKTNLVIAASGQPQSDGSIVQLFPKGQDAELWRILPVSP